MDRTRVDALMRSLASDGTRRGLLRRGAFGALGAALVGLGVRERAAAAECRGRNAPCRRGDQCCSGKCRQNKTCAPTGVGDPCDPNSPSDCRSGECGCIKKNTAGTLIDCTCRRATCLETADQGCDETADCCTGRCVQRSGGNICFPPAQQCIPEGQSCGTDPDLCCPGFDCIGGNCAA